MPERATTSTVNTQIDHDERRIEANTFLTTIASAFSVTFLLSSLFGSLLITSSSSFESFFVGIMYSGLSLFVLVFWMWPLSRMWRGFLFVGTILVVFVFGVGGLVNNLLDASAPNFASWIGVARLCAIVLGGAFWLEIVIAARRLASTPPQFRELYTTVAPGLRSLFSVIALLCGVHPICCWMPQRARRAVAAGLFVVSSLFFGMMLFLLMGFYFITPFGIVLPVACLTGSLRDAHVACSEAVIPPVIIVLTIGLGAGARYWARQLARLSVQELFRKDRRAPILFLRSFLDDQIKLRRPRRTLFQLIFGLGEAAPTLDHVLVEEGTGLGPVVAVGIPGKPPPFGAARTYLSDDDWQIGVGELASAARAIVIVADDTEGVAWELSFIRQSGLASKTLYLLPPRFTTPAEAKRVIGRDAIRHMDVLLAERVSADLSNVDAACVGWLHHPDGTLELFTTSRTCKTSYIATLRRAFGRAWLPS